MEKVETPKSSSFHWGCGRTSANRVGVDSEWDSDEVHREESQCGSDQSREFLLHQSHLIDNTDVPKLLDVAEGLNYLHTNHTVHGDLKGVSGFSGSSRAALTTLGQPNVLINRDGRALLADFGLASIVHRMNSTLATKSRGYAVRWAAPEILKQAGKTTREADMFAFGMVVIEVGPHA